MLRTRLLTTIFLIPVAVYLIHLGGLPFLVVLAAMLTLAVVEFCQLMYHDAFQPHIYFGVAMVWVFLLDAQFPELLIFEPGLTLVVFGSLTWYIFHRQGAPVANWGLTIAGGLYLGLCGAHLVKLRAFPDGMWWTLTAIQAIVLVDGSAYGVGRAWGKRKMVPNLSPGKTWAGYLAGVLIGAPVTGAFATLWGVRAGPTSHLSGVHGFFLALMIAFLAPLGDLAVSMIKRQVGVKDSGHIIPGHGGVLDRLDSILWAGVIGYYYVRWLEMLYR